MSVKLAVAMVQPENEIVCSEGENETLIAAVEENALFVEASDHLVYNSKEIVLAMVLDVVLYHLDMSFEEIKT